MISGDIGGEWRLLGGWTRRVRAAVVEEHDVQGGTSGGAGALAANVPASNKRRQAACSGVCVQAIRAARACGAGQGRGARPKGSPSAATARKHWQHQLWAQGRSAPAAAPQPCLSPSQHAHGPTGTQGCADSANGQTGGGGWVVSRRRTSNPSSQLLDPTTSDRFFFRRRTHTFDQPPHLFHPASTSPWARTTSGPTSATSATTRPRPRPSRVGAGGTAANSGEKRAQSTPSVEGLVGAGPGGRRRRGARSRVPYSTCGRMCSPSPPAGRPAPPQRLMPPTLPC